MKMDKTMLMEKLRRSIEIKEQGRKEARALLNRLQQELDTKGYYTVAR